MIFNGTAQELADLTRAFWAAEWWPKKQGNPLRLWSNPYPDGGSAWTFSPQGPMVGFEDHAASIIFAAAFEFVSIRGLTVPLLWRDFKDENKWAVIILGRLCEGPSPLHAILGAALEAAR